MSEIFWLSYFSGLSFLGFGLSCFLSKKMVVEFQRYGLDRFRTTTGFFQILGALGLLSTDFNIIIWTLSSLGLCVLMFMGFIVRLYIKDNWIQSFPSFFYMILNGYIFWSIYLL